MKRLNFAIILFLCMGLGRICAEMQEGAVSLSLGGIRSVSGSSVAGSGIAGSGIAGACSLFLNPAVGFSRTGPVVSMTFLPVYSMDDCYNSLCTALIPLKGMSLLAGFHGFFISGFYSGLTVSAGASFRITDKFFSGFTLKYSSVSVISSGVPAGNGSGNTGSAVDVDCGASLKIHKNLLAGLVIKNAAGNLIRLSPGPYASESRELDAGIRMNFLDTISLLLEEEFREDSSPVLKIGSELVFYDVFFIRAGLDRNTMFSAGAGLKMPHVMVDAAVKAHTDLGALYMLDLTLEF